ncbi:MAG: hypothetical protein HAW59_00060 [Betaproteobacteria bacterium]|nr:hypothetical protein [Betaproteobacteria bacterium]
MAAGGGKFRLASLLSRSHAPAWERILAASRRLLSQTPAAIVKFRPHWAARRRPICIPTLERGNREIYCGNGGGAAAGGNGGNIINFPFLRRQESGVFPFRQKPEAGNSGDFGNVKDTLILLSQNWKRGGREIPARNSPPPPNLPLLFSKNGFLVGRFFCGKL